MPSGLKKLLTSPRGIHNSEYTSWNLSPNYPFLIYLLSMVFHFSTSDYTCLSRLICHSFLPHNLLYSSHSRQLSIPARLVLFHISSPWLMLSPRSWMFVLLSSWKQRWDLQISLLQASPHDPMSQFFNSVSPGEPWLISLSITVLYVLFGKCIGNSNAWLLNHSQSSIIVD